jgi:hypothetical protein
MFPQLGKHLLLGLRLDLFAIPAHMHSARAIRSCHVLQLRRLCLTFQRSIATAQEYISQVVDAMIVMAELALIETVVFIAELYSGLVDEGGHVDQAVEFVEDSDREDLFPGVASKCVGNGRV